MDSAFGIVIALGLLAGLVAAVMIWRSRKPLKLPAPCCAAEEPAAQEAEPAPRSRLRRLFDALDYLRTRREWRYKTPWVLMVGEAGSGKSSLAASASAEHRQSAPARASELKAAGTEWLIFDNGVLIDPDGRYPAAPAGSKEAKEWLRILRDIEALRPERAIDGLLVAVSARSLLGLNAENRLALAEQTYRQLADIQQSFEFALPVYAVVTECDAIDGFSAFWQAQPEEKRREMFGWSTPSQQAGADPASWAVQAFDALAAQLQVLQLDAAAREEDIVDADRFVLFPRHFERLRAPAAHWMETVFQASGWHAGFLFRGLYFTGSVAADGLRAEGARKDVAFVDDLIARKVLAEPHLALPTRRGIWSRNRVIRSLQIGGALAFCALAVGLAFSAYKLNRQVDVLIASLEMLQKAPTPISGQACVGQDQVYPLLMKVSRIRSNAMYWAIPMSWVDVRANRKSAQLVADEAFERMVLPSLACQLEVRARELVALHATVKPRRADIDADAYPASQQALFDFLNEVHELERNLARFDRLARPAQQSHTDRLMQDFAGLAAYAYREALPRAVTHDRGALSHALAEVSYDGKPQLPEQMPQRFVNHATVLAAELRRELGQELAAGAVVLARLNRDEGDVERDTRHFTRWLAWTRESWLGSTEKNNPCETIRSGLAEQTATLQQHFGYPAALGKISVQFDAQQCYKPAMQTLNRMQLPPYGPLFTVTNGALDLNPKLQPELSGLKALAGLSFMQVTNAQDFACQNSGTGWRVPDIVQAGNYLRDYAEFARRQELPVLAADASARPLYDRLARRQLEHVVESTMRAAQAPDAAQPQQTSLQAASQADQQLSRLSANFGTALDPTLNVLRLLTQNGFSTSAMRITQCVRDYAADTLGRADALTGISRLYDPSDDSDDATFFNLGTTPVTLDYLARQISRSQVLAGYASPFVTFLQNTDAVNDVQRTNAQTAPYWNNTITELNRYVQFKETAGQVAHLHNLFLKQFTGLDDSNCEQTLGTYQSPAYSNDLFSQRRKELEEQAGWRCDDSRTALAYEAWRDLSTRFNRDLANRYPFADLGARDADPVVVKAFFTEYSVQSAALRKTLTGMSGAQWTRARRFLDQLDAVSAFFGANLAAGPVSQPVKLDVGFRAQPASSPGSNQVLSWTLASGGAAAGFPNRATALDWAYGQPLVLDLTWADRSPWRPAADPRQSGLQVSGPNASFAVSGRWALLRMIERHRPVHGTGTDPLDPNRLLLEFIVPVAGSDDASGKTATDTARLYLSLQLSGTDPKAQAPAVIALPPAFPRSIPRIQE